MNKYQRAENIGDLAYLALKLNYQKILKHENEVLKDKDTEELHQMRVGMRKLRSAIVGFSLVLKLPKNAGEKPVGKIAKILGELRDLDVLEETLNYQYRPLLVPSEQQEIDRALKYLYKQRIQVFKKVQKLLKGNEYQALKEGFKSWLENPQYQLIAHWKIQHILPDLLLPQISRFLLHQSWLVGTNVRDGEVIIENTMTPTEVEEILEKQGLLLHELRKEAKKTRYLMELFLSYSSQEYKNYFNLIKNIQTVLGEIQDSFVLGSFLTEVFATDFSKTMPNMASLLTTSRYNKWQQWQQLQQKFITPETRQDFHATILNPLQSNLVTEMEND